MMNRLFQYVFFIAFTSLLLSACNEDRKIGESRNVENLPKAHGDDRELFVVIDSALYAGPVGDILRDIYASPLPGLLQDEPWFILRQINPTSMSNNTLRKQRNLIFVTTLDSKTRQSREIQSYFSESSLDTIRNNPDRYYLSIKDEFARGQENIYLFGETQDELIANLEKHRKDMRKYMVDKTIKSLQAEIRKTRDKGIVKELKEDRGYSIEVPKGYYIAREFDNLVWLRQPDQVIDKSVFIYSIPYTDEKSFDRERIMALRDSVTREFLYDMDKRDLVFEIEPLVPLYTEEFTFNGRYAVETRGMWKLSDQSVGGPFISYMFVDEKENTLYYLDGFLIAPGQDKVEELFGLEAIMSTFRLSSDNASS